MTTTPAIPEDLIANALLYWGAAGRLWCIDLPQQVEALRDQWGCEIVAPFKGAGTAYVARVRRRDGSPAVLKIPYPDLHGERDALCSYGSTYAVEVFESEGSALLLEWCNPGRALRDIASADEARSVTLVLMAELFKTEPFPGIEQLAEQSRRYLALCHETLRAQPTLASPEIERGLAVFEELARTQMPEVLLHGDLHPGNILESSRRPWLVIDPKPLAGDPAYETIPLILEIAPARGRHLAQDEINDRIDLVARHLGLSPMRIAQWGAARRCDWALFCHRAHRAARAEQAERELRLFLGAIDAFGAMSSDA
ncbi:MAG TPA: aminoglycoside phosphotransferase family protein [Acidimicrobiales bacterium]|nr:aminoglycoside phosphotransferase family protein [Acidimicrobiales bacterium]